MKKKEEKNTRKHTYLPTYLSRYTLKGFFRIAFIEFLILDN